MILTIAFELYFQFSQTFVSLSFLFCLIYDKLGLYHRCVQFTLDLIFDFRHQNWINFFLSICVLFFLNNLNFCFDFSVPFNFDTSQIIQYDKLIWFLNFFCFHRRNAHTIFYYWTKFILNSLNANSADRKLSWLVYLFIFYSHFMLFDYKTGARVWEWV